jgi:hypothetical protein
MARPTRQNAASTRHSLIDWQQCAAQNNMHKKAHSSPQNQMKNT